MSSSSFDPMPVLTNSKQRMIEVSDGVYLQGKDLEEYCLKRGRCTICAKTKVRRKVIKVFGPNIWEAITAVKVATGNTERGKRGILGKRNMKTEYNNVKDKVNSGNDDNLDYLVYKGFCLTDGCYTLEQAKRLADCGTGKGIGGGLPSGKNISSTGSNSSVGSKSSKSKRKGFGAKLFRSKMSRSASSPNNPFLSPQRKASSPLLRLSSNSPNSQRESSISSISGMPFPAPPDELSYPNEIGNHQNDQTNTENDTDNEEVIPSPQARLNFQHEFSSGDSPKERYHSKQLYESALGSGDTNDKASVDSREPEPVREIVHRTISSLQGISLSPVIKTLDLTGLRFRRSEMDAMAKIFKAGKNGTVHLTSLVLDNCGIDDELLRILGQSLYDSLWTANNLMGNKTNQSLKVSKSMRHARMRLKSLCLGDNDIGNDGIKSLCPYLETISCELENLDLSRNQVETEGGISLFNAFRRNPQTKIRTIDLSCNLLGELDATNPDGSRQMSPTSYGQSYGIHGFLKKNRTLKELDLSANRMTDNGVLALCEGLFMAEDRSNLEKLKLGFNRIGDMGASALSKCISVNKSLTMIELNDNNIQNDGGLSLLSAMERNTTLREIAGLWSNKIDKRNIIVNIRQLLVSADRLKIINNNDKNIPNAGNNNNNNINIEEGDDLSDGDIYITTDSESTFQTRNGKGGSRVLDDEPTPVPAPPENPAGSPIQEEVSGFMSVEDNGNVSDLSDQEEDEDEDLSASCEKLLRDDCDEDAMVAADGMMETNQEVTHNMFDRMTIMNSSPLVCFDEKENEIRKGIPLQDTRLETEAIKAAVAEFNLEGNSRIEVRQETATLEKFEAFFSRSDSAVLHFSCQVVDGWLALEDGYGSLEGLTLGALKELVSRAGNKKLKLVFVSSSHSLPIGRAFRDAGISHVVCCHRDDKLRDPLAVVFMESFYKQAAQKVTLREAFDRAVQKVVSSPVSKDLYQVTQRFHLLPLSSHSPIFFQLFVPSTHHDKEEEKQERWNRVPPLPDNFVGREIEMFKILESLQVDDCVEISGCVGRGKETIVAGSLQYAMIRREMFAIDEVCWIPAPKESMVDPDSLYGELILCCDLIRDSSEDLWDMSEVVLDCRERLALKLEGAKVIVVIDNRSFSSKGCRTALAKFVNFIVTYTAGAKVICISATMKESGVSDYSVIKTSRIEIDALKFRSTALLFAENSEHVSRSNESTIAWSAKEFSELADIPFVPHTRRGSGIGGSNRRADIFDRMGNGLPSEVIAVAKRMSRSDFQELMKFVSKPEIRIDSLSGLENEVQRWKVFQDLAINNGNYKRAVDLQATLDELNGMRRHFSSLKDLKTREKSMKLELADAISSRRYDIANELKRDLLALKKTIMRERRVTTNTIEILKNVKATVDSLADAIEHDESMVSKETKSFDVDCDDHTCTFHIYSGNVYDPRSFPSGSDSKKQYGSKLIGIVCWSNEACDLNGTLDGRALLNVNNDRYKKCVDDLLIAKETRYGSVKCLMGNSIIITKIPPLSTNDEKEIMVPILTVGPFASPSGQNDVLLERDNEYYRFSMTTLRSCYRSCVGQTNREKLHALVIQPMSTRTKSGRIYKDILRVSLQTILDEAKFASDLREVHIVAKSPKEAMLLAGIMKQMGYLFRHEPVPKKKYIDNRSE